MGEKVLTERPILLIRNNEHSKFDSWAENVVNLVKDLPQEKLKKFLELADNEYFDKTPEFLYLKGVKMLRCNTGLVNMTKGLISICEVQPLSI